MCQGVDAKKDLEKIKNMTPSQLEAYKQEMQKQLNAKAKQLGNQAGVGIDPIVLPGYDIKPPVKDIKRLSSLPIKAPSRIEMVNEIKASAAKLKAVLSPTIAQSIESELSTKPATVLHDEAVTGFYQGNQLGNLYQMMQLTGRFPDSLLMVNNLGAMLNMVGAEHKAIPLLQFVLEKIPESSTVLNNIGQAYMGLGDLAKATAYLEKALKYNESNIESLHSMGMLKYFNKEYAAAMTYFDKEMKIGTRKSTMALASRLTKKYAWAELARQRAMRRGAGRKNYFEEVALGKFDLPVWPSSAEEAIKQTAELQQYTASVAQEMLYWQNLAASITNGYNNPNRMATPRFDLISKALENYTEDNPPEWYIYMPENLAEVAVDIMNEAGAQVALIECPQAPPLSSREAVLQLQIKCCRDKRKPIADQVISQLTSLYKPVYETGISRYKTYINGLIDLFQQDPAPYNQSIVYAAFAGYFQYLHSAALIMHFEYAKGLVNDCHFEVAQLDVDSLLKSERDWRMKCPSWMQFEANLGVAKIKTDCDLYQIEGGSGIYGKFKHDFKSGLSTVMAGPGARLSAPLIASAKATSMIYITYDQDYQMADFGWENAIEVKANGLPGIGDAIKVGDKKMLIEVGNSISINSGYHEKLEVKGLSKIFD